MSLSKESELMTGSVVLLGEFTPTIFQPSWFAQNKIVGQSEADSAVINVIHPDVASFELGSKQIVVESTKFSVSTSSSPWVSLSDFVVKTFGEVLTQVPIASAGINLGCHFRMKSAQARVEMGRVIAPLGPWGEFGEEISRQSSEVAGGIASLAMQLPWEMTGLRGHWRIQVSPSTKISGELGVFVHVNHHMQCQDEHYCNADILGYISNEFERAIQRCESLIDQVMQMAIKVENR